MVVLIRCLAFSLLGLLLLALATLPTTTSQQTLLAGALLLVLTVLCTVDRRRTNAGLKLFIMLIGFFLSSRYIYWRATETLPLEFGLLSMVLGLIVFGAELHGYLNGAMGSFTNVQPTRREAPELQGSPHDWPTLDIYIPTYNEDPGILLSTIVAATQLDYPPSKTRVYVLDDGGTRAKLKQADPIKAREATERAQAIRALCVEFGAHYRTRERNDHAKAGNMNAALPHTNGELLLMLDCDHVPSRDIARRTVGFFQADPKLFLVQTPHNFASPDPLERNLDTHRASPAESALFYEVIQPGLDFWGTTFFCGSAAMLRRSVLDELGGFSGQTITEDAETTLDAISLGYATAYYSRPMVAGLQPDTFSSFIQQRVRWSQGMLQILLLKNPLKAPGLTWVQKLLYANFAHFWGFATARLILLLAPAVFLLFSVNLVNTNAADLLAYSVPALLAAMIQAQYLYGHVRWPFVSQIYEVLQSVFITAGFWAVLRNPRSPTFKVTPKGETLEHGFISNLATPFYVLLIVNALALGVSVLRLDDPATSQGALLYVGFWAALDTLFLLCALGVTLERPQRRCEPRVPVQGQPVQLRLGNMTLHGQCVDASANGLQVHCSATPQQKEHLLDGATVHLTLANYDCPLEADLRHQRPLQTDMLALGLRYRITDSAQRRTVIDLAYGSSEQLLANNLLPRTRINLLTGLALVWRWALLRGCAHLLHKARRILRPRSS